MTTVNMSIRMDAELKKQAERMFGDMGLNTSTAVTMFLRQVVRQGKIPFEIATDIPNAETLAAMQEMDDMLSGKFRPESTAAQRSFLRIWTSRPAVDLPDQGRTAYSRLNQNWHHSDLFNK